MRTLQGLPLTMLILGGSIDTQLGKDPQGHCKDYLWQCWSWGLIDTQLGKDPCKDILCKDYLWQCWSWGSQLTHQLGKDPGGDDDTQLIHEDIGRITSDNVDPGGSIDTQLGKDPCKDIGRITSDNVDPGGGGSIDTQLGKDPQGHCKDYLWQCWSWGQSTHNLERIHEDFARITSDNVDPGGSIDGQLGKDPLRLCKDYLWQCWSWGGQLTHNLERIHKDFARITSDNVDPGGESMVNLERIHKDFGRITSDNVDPVGVNWQSTWKGSTKTLQGLPLTMLILGGSINSQLGKDPWRLCKDYLWQCWSWGSIDGQLGKDLQRLCKDYLWQCWSWGVNWQSTWKGSMKTLQGLPLTMLILGGQSTVNLERICKDFARITSDNVDPGGGQLTVNLERILWRLCKDYLWQCWSWGVNQQSTWKGSKGLCKDYLWQCWSWGVDWHTTWKGSGGHCKDYLWQCWSWGSINTQLGKDPKDFARITSDNVDPGGLIDTQLGKDPWRHCKDYLWQCWSWGSINTQLGKDPWGHCKDYLLQCWSWGLIETQLGKDPQGHCKDYLWQCWSRGLIDTQLGKDPWGHCKDYLWQCWSWGVQLTHNLERIHKDIARITSDNVDPGWGQSTHNLERIREDIASITSDNVDLGLNQHTTWKGSMRTLQGLPLTVLIWGVCQSTHNLEGIHEDIARITSDNVDPGGSIDTQLEKDLQGHCKDYPWQCWPWRGQSTCNLERIHEDIARITSENVDPGVQLTHNLERIHKDIARITSDNVYPGWGQSTHNLERIHEDIARITSDNVDLGLNQHTTWKGSMRTLQGLPLTVLIWGCVSINTQLGRDPWGHCKDYLW